jgi:hypothetical protein
MLSKNRHISAGCNARSFEEPGAVIPHAGICEGDSRVTGCSTSIVSQRWKSVVLKWSMQS